MLAETETTIASIRSQGEVDTVELDQALAARQSDAVDFVAKLVSSV